MERTDQPSALCLIIDANPREWASRSHAELAALLDHLLIFANGFHLLSASNQLVVLCVHPSTVRLAWPPTSRGADAAAPVQPRALRSAVDQAVQQLLALPVPDDDGPESSLAAALALALCRLQRLRREQPKVQPRILLAHATPDVPDHHLACMNCVFAAQKQDTLVDTLALAPRDSLLLQQAAELTGGNYLRPDTQAWEGLTQYLLTCMLPDPHVRRFLRPPAQGLLETRALCHLSRAPVEVGWACSVCLTVFADDKRSVLPACPVCATRFTISLSSGPPKPKKRKKPAAAAAAAPAPAAAPPPAPAITPAPNMMMLP
jgi:transcription initiation factor TFIIH subunit 3